MMNLLVISSNTIKKLFDIVSYKNVYVKASVF